MTRSDHADHGYLPTFRYDVFVSYAHVDNEILVRDAGQQVGWVHLLVDRMKRELRARLGGRNVRILFDHEFIRGNLPLTPQILDKVKSSALLLIVSSPSYLASAWCEKERNAFLSLARDRVAAGSIQIVRARPTDRADQPEPFRDLSGIDFFETTHGGDDHRLLGPLNGDEQVFDERIRRLCRDVVEQLKKLRVTNRNPNIPPPHVFLATATDDLDDREQDLRSYLEQAGVKVLPSRDTQYPTTDLAAYEAAVSRDLSCCPVFAQVLSSNTGRAPHFARGKRLPWIQYDLASRSKKKLLQWRDRDIDLLGVKDDAHRALLNQAQAWGFDEFERAVLEAASRSDGARPPTRQVTAVFVNADAPERALAAQIRNALNERDIDCYWRPEHGTPEQIRAAVESGLKECDGLILVYGERLDWLQSQFRQARKIEAVREHPLAALAVFDGPPVEKPELALASNRLFTVDCRRGLDRTQLQQFLDKLAPGSA